MLFGWPSGYSPSTSSLSKIANFLKIFSIFCFQCFYYNTSITYWGSMFSEATFREILLPSSEWEKYLSKRSFTKNTCPWCDNFIILLETSFRIIMFAISIFCLSRCPFLLFLMNWNRSYLRQCETHCLYIEIFSTSDCNLNHFFKHTRRENNNF